MAAGAGATLLLALGIGAVALYSGIYDVAAARGHTALVYRVLETGMRESVRHHSAPLSAPLDLDEERLLEDGAVCFHQHCVQCHGAPGEAPAPFALGLTPAASNLAHTAREWKPAEIYWVVRNGIKMAGMPAWLYRMSEEDLWAVTAFVMTLPALSPQQYREFAASLPGSPGQFRQPLSARPDVARGRAAIDEYACVTCHEIPGIVGAQAPVGPPLGNFGRRRTIAGLLPNTHENLVRWLRAPQSVDPQSAMPDLGVTEQHAHDMAAYLLNGPR